MSAIGHGQYGLRDKIRSFRDLVSESSHARRPYVDLVIGKAIEGGSNWVASGSNQKTTITAASLTYGGVIRAVVGVESMVLPRPLRRVESIADLVAGTWYYDDDSLVAGGSTDLYVRLPDSSDPDGTTVVLHLLFNFGTIGEIHPILGPEKNPNATMESWASSTDLNDFSESNVGASGVVVTKETVDVFQGLAATTVTPGASGLAAGTFGGLNTTPQACVGGATYLVSVAYQTDPLLNSGLSARLNVRLGPTGDSMLLDGVSQAAGNNGLALGNTGGAWLRATFVWRCPSDQTQVLVGLRLHNASGAAITGGYVRFDDFHFQRVWRYSYYAPLLDSGSVPELELMAATILFGPRTIGIGNLSMLDGDGSLTKTMAALLYFDKPAMVYAGGAYTSGEEVTRDDWRIAFPALTRGADFRDGEVKIDLEDAFTLSRVKVAQAAHRIADAATMDANMEGNPKGLLFGVTQEYIIAATRVSKNSNGYGFYEFLDPAVPVADAAPVELPGTPSFKVYPNKELADQDLQGLTITDGTNDFGLSNQNTRWEVKRDIRNYQYDRGGNDVGTGAAFTFEHGAVVFTAKLNISGPAYKVAADLQAAMRALAGGTSINVTYDEGGGGNPHKFSVGRTGVGSFKILMQKATAVEPQVPGWELLGFDKRTDRTGAAPVTFVGDFATFTDADKDHVLRFSGGGYKDDAAGSICGSASQSLNTPPAIASWILQKVMRVPPAQIDVASFGVARTASLGDFTQLFAYLAKGEEDAYGALAWLCQIGLMTLNVGADRVWRAAKYSTGTVGARSFTDSDYLAGSFRMWKDPATIFKEVRIWGAYHPARAEFRKYSNPAGGIIDTAIPVKHGSEGVFEVFGFLDETVITAGVALVQNYYGKLISAVPRNVEFSATGKLVDLSIGDKVLLTRTGPGVLDPSGAISALAFRVVGLKHDYLSGVSRCVGVEDVALT